MPAWSLFCPSRFPPVLFHKLKAFFFISSSFSPHLLFLRRRCRHRRRHSCCPPPLLPCLVFLILSLCRCCCYIYSDEEKDCVVQAVAASCFFLFFFFYGFMHPRDSLIGCPFFCCCWSSQPVHLVLWFTDTYNFSIFILIVALVPTFKSTQSSF